MTCHDDVIVNHYVKIAEYFFEFPGELPVGGRRQGASAGMIVSQNHSGRTVFQAGLDDLPRENGGPVYAPLLYMLDGDQPVLAVQSEHAENFVSLGAQKSPEI